jgi:hypothetical protein
MTAARGITLLLVLGGYLSPAGAGDPSTQLLDAARTGYVQSVEKYKEAATNYFDKREEDARTKGDKKAVDLAKKERAAFTASGDLPAEAVPKPVADAVGPARQKVNQAYMEVVKELIKEKRDRAAEAVEKERREFLVSASLFYGRRTPLTNLRPYDIRARKSSFANFAALKTKERLVPFSITLYPTSGSVAQASYPLSGKWAAFHVHVGIPEFPDTAKPPASEVTFELIGDGDSLWKSKPTKELNESQLAKVCVEKIMVLTLRVHCPGSSDWCRACWLEAILTD